jgi:hypothetical protein
MVQVCDFLSPQNLSVVAQHYAGIVRYPKNITTAEFHSALANGLTVTLVQEGGSQPAMRGAAGGQQDAQYANQIADSIGYDPAATIYYVAEDPTTLPGSAWPTVEQYFQAVNANSKRPVGGYGGLGLTTHLQSMGLITKKWCVQTWGGTDANTHLEQLVGVNTFGLAVDADQVLQADYGQHPRPGGPTPTPTPSPSGGVEMPVSQAVSYRAGQIDVFQVAGGALWHKWDQSGKWANESVTAAAGLNPQPSFPNQTPAVVILGSQCIVTVEDSGGRAWFFAQNASGGGWGVNELP